MKEITLDIVKGQRAVSIYRKRTVLCLSLSGPMSKPMVTPHGIVRDRKSVKEWLNGHTPRKMEPIKR